MAVEIDVHANDTNERLCGYDDLLIGIHHHFIYIMGPIIVLGLILNVLNIVVLRRAKSPSNAFFMLQFLAVSDMMYLIICLLYFPIRHLVIDFIKPDYIGKRFDPYLLPELLLVIDPMYYMTILARNWMVVVITIERLLNIVAPLWARTTITKFRLKIVVAVVYLVSVLIRVDNYVNNRIQSFMNECGQPTHVVSYTSVLQQQLFHSIFVVGTVLVPQCLIYLANVLLLIGLRKSELERLKMATCEQGDSKHRRQATTIVLAMSVVFSVCETPSCIDRLMYVAGFTSWTQSRRLTRVVSLVLNVVDSSINFFAYCASNRLFRRNFTQLLQKNGIRNIRHSTVRE